MSDIHEALKRFAPLAVVKAQPVSAVLPPSTP